MAFDLQPNLNGKLIDLRPLTPGDWDDLFAAASDPLIWEQHPASDRYKEDVFKIFFKEALDCGGAFVVLNKKTHAIIGSTRFYGHDPEKSEIEIGWTFLARRYWGGLYNRELKELMLAHAFTFIETVVFYVGETNIRSQKAMEKLGAIKTGIVQRHHQSGSVSHVKYLIRKPTQ
jgi:RimJ/RimL family protein N-acetyltransferase